MSTTIDEKVVEMRFDNRQFESNVKNTLSTLDKLKEKLNLSGASKGLENLGNIASKVDMSGMSRAVESVTTRFSALEVMGVTALANITNSAVNAGKRMVKALTVDPVMDGWREYEMTLNAVQTTMNATGKTAKQVEDELKKLDEYADKTVYSTADMLNNLPKFTNAGVELEKATTAMIGIANATALAGGDASKASIAFYNLGQAIGTGYLTRMDYNSINNAGIATMEWKEQMVKAAIAAGTLTEAGDGLYKAGKKTFTIQQLFIDGLQEQWATTDVMMEVFGKYGNALDKDVGEKAWEAATKVKTFTSMMESLKATAGTGWKETWQLIFGDLDVATKFWTGINNFISGIISGMADLRNKFLNSFLGKSFTGVLDSFNNSLEGVKKSVETIKSYANVVNEILGGKWGNGKSRWDKLAKSGYDWAHAQNLVNEKLGNAKRHATNYKEAQEGIAESQGKVNEATTAFILSLEGLTNGQLKEKKLTDDQIEAFRELEKVSKNTGIPLKELLENIDEINGRWLLIESFKNIGKSLVSVFKSVGDAFKDAFSMPTDAIFNAVTAFHKLTRIIRDKVEANAEKLTRTLKGLFAIIDIIATFVGGVFGTAFKVAFTVVTTVLKHFNLGILDVTAAIGDFLVKVRDWIEQHNFLAKAVELVIHFVEYIRDGIKHYIRTNEELNRSLEVIREKYGKIVDKIKSVYKEHFNLNNILTKVKNALTTLSDKISKWISKNETLSKALGTISSVIDTVTESIKNFISENEFLSGALDGIKTAIDSVSDKFSKWGEILDKEGATNLAKHIIEGLADGLISGAGKVGNAIVNVAKNLITRFCEFLGIESPSKVFFTLGGFIISGLILGLKDSIPSLKAILEKIFGTFEKINWNTIMNGLRSIAAFFPQFAGLGKWATLGGFFSSLGIDSMEKFRKGIIKGFEAVKDVILSIGPKTIEFFRQSIHSNSPSKDTEAVGWDWVLGFIEGIKSFASKAWEAIKNFGKTCVDTFKAIDFGKLFAAGLSVGMLYLGKKMFDSITNISTAISSIAEVGKNLTAPAVGIKNLLTGLGEGVKNFTKGYKNKRTADIIKSAALAIAVLAGSVFLLSKVDADRLWPAIGAIAVLVLIVGALAGAMVALDAKSKEASTAVSSGSLLAVGATLFLLALTLKQLASIESGKLEQAVIGLIAVIVALGVLLKAIAKIGGNKTDLANIHKIGTMVRKIAVALLLMVVVIKIASMMSLGDIVKGIAVVAALGVLVRSIIAISHYGSADADKAGKMISKISFAMLLMVGVIKLASMLELGEVIKGISVVTALGVLFGALIVVSNKAGPNAAKAGWFMFQMSFAFLMAVGVVKVASMLNEHEISKGITLIGALGLLFTGLIAVSQKAGKNAIKAGAMLLEVSFALLLLTGVLFILGKFADDPRTYAALGIVGILELFMMGLINSARGVRDCSKSIREITILIGVIVAAVALLAFIPAEKLKQSMTAMISIMAGLSVMLIALGKSTKDIQTSNWGDIGKSMTLLAGVVGAIALLCVVLATTDPDTGIETAAGIALLLTAMSGVMFILSKINVNMGTLGAVGILAVLGLVVAEIAAILGALAKLDVQPSIGTAAAISLLLLGMSVALGVLAIVGSFAVPALAGVCVLEAFILSMGVIITALGELDLDKATKGIQVLEKIGYGLGAFISNFLAGLTDGLPEMATNLSSFMENLKGFIDEAERIGGNENILTGVTTLIDSIKKLAEADEIASKGLFTSHGSGLPKLGTNLSEFMTNIEGFIKGLDDIDETKIGCAEALSKVIYTLASADELLDGGFLNSSFKQFTPQLKAFGEAIVAYSGAVSGGSVDVQAVEDSAKAASSLIEVANSIKAGEGVINFFTGESGLQKFGNEMVNFAGSLIAYSLAVSGGSLDAQAVKDSTKAGTALIEMASKIQASQSVLGFFTGETGLGQFGKEISTFAKDILAYSMAISGGSLDTEAIKNSVGAADLLMQVAGKIEKGEGAINWISGNTGLSAFGAELTSFAASMISYANSVGEGKLNTEAIKSSVTAADLLIGLAEKIPNGEGWATWLSGKGSDENFVSKLKGVAKDMVKYGEKAAEIDITAIVTSEAAFDSIKNILDGIKGVDASGVESFKSAMESLSTISFDSVMNAFNTSATEFVSTGASIMDNIISGIKSKTVSITETIGKINSDIIAKIESYQARFKIAGKLLMEFLRFGIEDNETTLTTSVSNIMSSLVSAITDKYESFKGAGSHVVSGFVNGISENTFRAEAAARAMAQAALNAAKKALDEHSPSRAFYEVGDFAGLGFVNALTDSGASAYDAGYTMAELARDGLSRAITRVSDLINDGIDTQPTIRPVLDLTEVESGAGYLSSMFNNPSIGVMSNLNAISSGMNSRSQNGVNDDVVSAIDKLRRDLGNVGGDTYNIDGVTYDDGSNIATAVKDIVRAVRKERRK